MQAVSDDDEVARAVLARRDDTVPHPPLAQWTPELDTLAQILDRLGNLIGAVMAVAGNSPPRVTPALRPHTAFDRQRLEIRMTTHRRLVAQLLPDQHDT
jgi:hypothetical protein